MYKTGNPVPSSALEDMADNAQVFDNFVNSSSTTTPNRNGASVKTRAGFEADHDSQIATHENEHDAQMQAFESDFDAQILNMGFARVGTFAAGATLTNPRQTLLWDIADDGDGQEYGWSGAFPKVVPATSTPASTGGISVSAWISRFDPELRIQVREALRRSYAEAGYNLVAGSFEVGGTLVNANDVLLYEASGKVFSGPAGTVAAGTNPASGGFVDRSGDLTIDIDTYAYIRAYDGSATKLRALGRANLFDHAFGMFVLDSNDTTTADDDGVVLVGAGGRRWKRQITGIDVLPEWWGAKGDDINDDSDSLQSAINFSFNKQYRVLLSKGVYKTTKELLLTLGQHYSQPGLRITGAGKSSSIIKLYYENTAAPISILNLTNAAPMYNLEISELGLLGTNRDAITACLNVYAAVSGLQLDNLDMGGAITGVWLRKDAWINKFLSLYIHTRDYGIRMDASGTTNTFDNCFVYGTNICAYKLVAPYSTIGALAADNCIGTVYNLDYFSGSIGSLGSEFPVKGRTPTRLLVSGHGHKHIGYLLGYLACPTNGIDFSAVDVGDGGDVIIDFLELSQNDQTDPNPVVNGRVVSGYRGTITIHKLIALKDLNDPSSGSLVFSSPTPVNSPITLVPPTGTPFNVTYDAKPLIGLGKEPLSMNYSGVAANLTKRPLQNIYFDAAGGPNGSGVGENYLGDRDRWALGAEQGSWMMEVDPALRGCAGYAVTITGSDMNRTEVARIPIVEVIETTATLPTTALWDGRSVKVRALHKTLTYYTYWSAGWYDEAGTKVV